MIKIQDRRKDLRPREKMQARGVEALSDYELLMAIIGSGNAQADVTKIARELLKVLRRARENLGRQGAFAAIDVAYVAPVDSLMKSLEGVSRASE